MLGNQFFDPGGNLNTDPTSSVGFLNRLCPPNDENNNTSGNPGAIV
jgi:hypothetical protein